MEITAVTTKRDLNEKLNHIQTCLKVPKTQTNTFSHYQYRNCEDILESIKPYLAETKTTLVIPTEVVIHEGIPYQLAKAIFSDGENYIVSTAEVRECTDKKGMSGEQISGSAISYARKYALNGLLAIDDSRDSDSENNNESDTTNSTKKADITGQQTKKVNAPETSKQVQNALKNAQQNTKWTAQQTEKITQLFASVDSKGNAIFTEKDKAFYRDFTGKLSAENIIENVQAELEHRLKSEKGA